MSGSALDRSTIELWWSSVDEAAHPAGALMALLAPDERRRADRFRVAAGRRRYVTARAMLRCLLGRHLEMRPRDIRLIAGPRGKPELDGSGTSIRFNISHSGDIVVAAFAAGELGVDVETLRPVPRADRLAERFFAESERRRLIGGSDDESSRRFLQVWTCKEAYLKALGTGLGVPLCQIEVDPEQPALLATPGGPEEARRWTLLQVELPVAALCSVAIRGGGWRLEVREFDWQTLERLT